MWEEDCIGGAQEIVERENYPPGKNDRKVHFLPYFSTKRGQMKRFFLVIARFAKMTGENSAKKGKGEKKYAILPYDT